MSERNDVPVLSDEERQALQAKCDQAKKWMEEKGKSVVNWKPPVIADLDGTLGSEHEVGRVSLGKPRSF